jgi:integrase
MFFVKNSVAIFKWPMVDTKVGLFRLPGRILKEKVARRTPVSYEMREVLEELRDEQRNNKVENIAGHVFTRHDGRPIKDSYKAFAAALGDAKLQDSGITPRSFRRAAISRWTALGIPRDLTMLFSGHRSRSTNVHDSYLHFDDDVLVKQFKDKGLLLPPQQR